jgi:serine protease Do
MRTLLLLASFMVTSFSAVAYDKTTLMKSFFSVVMIRGYTESGGVAYGSGVVIGKNKVVTNCHVLRQTKKPWVSKGEDVYPINAVKADTWHDLCIVETDPMPFEPVQIGNTSTLTHGQEVVGFGHSNGSPAPLTSTGSIKGLYSESSSSGRVIRTSAKFLMGASGSGLFDMDGKLIGVNTFKTAGKGDSIHFAVPVEWLDALDKTEAIKSFPITGKALWEEDENKKPFYMQAAVPESREDWQTLAKVAEKWTTAEPKSAEAWYAQGIANENLGQIDIAKKMYKTASDLDSQYFEALVHLGVLAKKSGDNIEMHRVQLELAKIDQGLANEYASLLGCEVTC